MRLHHLQITAFGPFAGSVEVDFDALGDAGLFLLTGPTGAGKSSVLDAVCFALYAAVPGDRNTARHLRSDLAPPDVAPEVTLELTLAGRRLRIVRSPAWLRPRKRGAGTTRQQAGVVLTEHRAGAWQPVTNRIDEAGDLLSGLIGLTMTQFCQVAMLPQGKFQAFLRAGPDERRTLLARLFRTSRFDQVEAHLRDRRVELRRESAGHQAEVAEAVARLAEAAGAERPPEWDPQQLEEPAETGALADWSKQLTDRAESRLAADRAAETDARAAATAAEAAHAEAVRVTGLRARHAEATERLRLLSAAQQRIDADRATLAAAEQARVVRPAAELADRLQAEHHLAADRLRRAREPLADHSDSHSDESETCLRRAEAETGRAAALEALRPRAARRQELVAAIASAGAQRADVARERDQIATALAEVPEAIAAARARVVAAETAAARLPAIAEQIDRLETRRTAAETVRGTQAALTEAQALLVDAQAAVVAAGDTLIRLRDERLAGMAAEMAGALAAGCACPVCGSADHPAPADPSGSGPDAAAEKAAQAALDDAKAVQTARDGAVRDLRTVLASATATSEGRSVDELDRELAALDGDLASTTESAADLAEARQALADQESHAADLNTRQAALSTRLAELAASIDGRTQEATAIADELGDALPEAGADVAHSLAAAAADHRRAAERWRGLAAAIADESSARRRAEAARATASEAARDAGFDDLDSALDALLDDDRMSRLRSAVADHETRLAGARATLADPDVIGALATSAVPIAEAAAERERTAETLRRAHAAATAADRRARRLQALDAELVAALARWSPIRERWQQVADLAALVEGKHPDNRWQMRLSAYVLTHRLGQVVAAANERLAAMSDGRYQLEHTGQRGAGESRGGLSLLVRDDWSGEARDPSTLSGGETFLVSLALALGLADVITHEAGGAALDTLFVDEGFGSLDADTLDDVLDTLDSLRAGGRVVGVISHVAEMADRIPAQLRVGKSPTGSTLTTAC